MSEDSISYGEDKENLLYISKKINVDEFGVGEEGLFRESITSNESESEFSSRPVGSEIQIIEDIKETTFDNPDLAARIKPFNIRWSFGINASTGVINISNETRKELFFSSVHLSVLYNYCTREMRHLEGHQSVVNCISSGGNGDWLVSSDLDKDGCVIVWSSKELKPVYTLFNLYPESGVLVMSMSSCARYLVTIGEIDEEYYKVDFWLWTLGQEQSDERPLDDEHYVLDDCDYLDIEEDISKLVAMDAPFDASLQNNPFVLDNFFLSTADSNIYAVDFLNNLCTPLFHVADADISAIDAHDEKPYIVIGYENGRIALINYETKEQIANYVLPKTDESSSGGDIISCLKYSNQSFHLVCGRNNGEVWVLKPIVLVPKSPTPFRCTKNKVVKMVFSHNSMQFAYYDNNRTVSLFNYNYQTSTWVYQGKIRSHYDAINDIKFFFMTDRNKSVLYTIGDDRYLVGYNNLDVTIDGNEVFSVTLRERIEQTSTPKNFVYFAKTYGSKKTVGYFLIADDHHKLKLLHESTRVIRSLVLGPAYGCFKDAPIRKMKMLQQNNVMKHMVFICKRHLGIHIFPPDGNPYKYTGYMAHPIEVRDFVVSHDGLYAFSFGVEDRCVLKWEIRPRTVELFNLMGGTELEPYYSLIEGGKQGWLFHEIQDLFFYMQILQQENIDLPRRVSDSINLSEIPDLVRTCGFYPSDFELETMMIDIRYRDFDESGMVRDEITFVEFVKLFLNHRPAYGYNLEDIKANFETVCSMADYPKRGRIENHDLVYLFQTVGEPSPSLHKNLTTLLRISTYGENNFEFLPPEIDVNFMLYELMGIDPDRTEKDEYSTQNKPGNESD